MNKLIKYTLILMIFFTSTMNIADALPVKLGKYKHLPQPPFEASRVEEMLQLNDGRIFISVEKDYGEKVVTDSGYEYFKNYSVFYIFDPKTETYKQTAESKYKHHLHRPIVLNDGRVFISSRYLAEYEVDDKNKYNVELYNPITDTFKVAGRMNYDRIQYSNVKLQDGRILITGGYNNDELTYEDLKKFYPNIKNKMTDKEYQKFTKNYKPPFIVNKYTDPKDVANACIIDAYGLQSSERFKISKYKTQYSEIFDPKTEKFHFGAKINKDWQIEAKNILLNDGTVLSINCNIAEIYDPKANVFTKIGDLNNVRSSENAYHYGDDRVLIIDRIYQYTFADLYDPITKTFKLIDSISDEKRTLKYQLELKDGYVAIIGGYRMSNFLWGLTKTELFVNKVEVFNPKIERFVEVGSCDKSIEIIKSIPINDDKFFCVTKRRFHKCEGLSILTPNYKKLVKLVERKSRKYD